MKTAKKAGILFTTAYLLLMFCIYPFYMENGYVNIGEAKIRFFLLISLASIGILGLIFVLYIFLKWKEQMRQGRAYLVDWEKVSATDLLVLLFATEVFLSYVLTDHREEALWGTEGWRIGCIPLLLLCGLYFLISRLWKENAVVFYGMIATSTVVFFLGICNRFSFYPIHFEIVESNFLSTLGNINWYCGYLSVVAPVGIVSFLFYQKKREGLWQEVLLGVYVILVFVAGLSQGGSSIFLWFLALFFALLWIALENRIYLKRWFLLVGMWGISAQLVRLLRYLLPERYNYDTDNLCGYFTDSSTSLWIMAAAMICGIVFCGKKYSSEALHVKRIRKWLMLTAGIGAAAWLCLTVLHTVWGLPFLHEGSSLYFDENWGNGRGATLMTGWMIWKELPFVHKMLGVGPDCFSIYAYGIPELSDFLRNRFGSARLTNAHCELLTLLVNTGIFGVVFYVGIFASFIVRCLKFCKDRWLYYVFAVCAFCYFVHNMVSFAQVLNLPFVFLLMGMGESLCHEEQ